MKTDSSLPAPAFSNQDHRLVAMLFDFGGMTADEQSKIRQAGIQFVENSMRPTDLVCVMGAGPVTVAQDFTDNKSVLESVIQTLNAGTGGVDVNARLANIETASKLLTAFPQKKALIYFSAGITQTGTDNQTTIARGDQRGSKGKRCHLPGRCTRNCSGNRRSRRIGQRRVASGCQACRYLAG